jgi:hypothetical protein
MKLEFEFNPLEASVIAESLHRITEAGIPYVKIYNLKHLVVPKAMKHFSLFRRFVLKKRDSAENTSTDKDLLTIEDFKTFEVVRARDTQLGVKSTDSGELISLEATAYRYGTGYLLGRWGSSMRKKFVSAYKTMEDLLPIPIVEVPKMEFDNDDFYTSSFTVLTFSTAILTFLYFLYTFNPRKVNHKYMTLIASIEGSTATALDRIEEISERLQGLGNNFPTMLENLRIVSYFL